MAAGLGLFLLSLGRSLADAPGLTDERWFLQVVSRVAAGDVLYRDVFFGSTPLSVYITSWITAFTGVEALAVKAITNLAFTITVLLACRIARAERLGTMGAIALASLLIVTARPYANPPYTPVAMMFLMATLAATLDGGRRAHLIGVFAGLSFASKHNVGLLALLAALAAIWADARNRTRALPATAGVSAAFGATVLLALAPVIISGGLPGLLEYGLLGKGNYVMAGNVSYVSSLLEWTRAIASLPPPSAAISLLHGLPLVMPIALAAVALAEWRSLEGRRRTLVVFAAAAVAVAFPRWDRFHLSYALPFETVAAVAVLQGSSVSKLMQPVLAPSLAMVCLALALASPVRAFFASDIRSSRLPHARGIWMTSELDDDLLDTAARLAAAAEGHATLLLGSDAGFWYLSSGVENPTPFDMPAITSVGRRGAPWLIERLSNGELRQVCVPNAPPTRLTLAEVESFVRTRFIRGLDIGPCTMYRAPNAPSASTDIDRAEP
jgi:hypothetical protein